MTISTTHATQGAAVATPARPCLTVHGQWRDRMGAGMDLGFMYGNSIKRTARRLGKATT